jgi:hypothetical protein
MNLWTRSKTLVAACCALSLGLLLAGCSGSKTLSKAGESCASSGDCDTGLACYSQICATGPIVVAGQDAGTVVVAPDAGTVTPTPVLSQEFESCSKHSDCVDPLYCVDQACTRTAPKGTTPKPPGNNTSYGQRGETCTTAADCATGLACLALTSGTGAPGLGRCDIQDYGLTPTGKTCAAECQQNIDCCELPVGTTDSVGTALHSCQDLVAILGNNPSGCQNDLAHQRECFLWNTYCNCQATNPWVCDPSSGRCSYTATCQANARPDLPNGCPSLSRGAYPLVTFCSASKCAYPAPIGCASDGDCVGQPVVDDASDTCSTNECICNADDVSCYRKCAIDLDCAAGFTCDTSKHLCRAAGSCDNDAFCTFLKGDVTAKCVQVTGATYKTCEIPCATDHDCSNSGLNAGASASDPNRFNGFVCYQDVCTPVGCSSDADCFKVITVGTDMEAIKMFCETPPSTGTTSVYSSAITN